jgi:uncharacterized membrane protein
MRTLWRLLKATLVGGLLFLVPLILMGLVLKKGLEIAEKIVGPIVRHSPVHTVLGVTVVTLASGLALLLVALAFGVVAQTAAGRRIRAWLEATILGKVPAYSLLRGMLDPSILTKGAQPALAWVEESWVYALVLEVHEDGHRTVFIPGAPNPLSGSIYFLPESRVRNLDMPLPTFFKQIRALGIGSRELLRGRLSASPE